ncbi:hypothetical protein [Flavobacterium anhuiense]|uniref:hypothetical protein n=1 Tax=Flavobacterium anhuiense TaxID=459526 RepID=UPI0020262095|nr:hypothetical protein [Flavobacterium anhuiense]URM37151.1 hypothetical protein LLY39_00740 [Flavobacterium anhuiense]
MKKSYTKKRKGLFNWLLYSFLIDFVEKEMSFQIQFIENDKTVSVQQMYVVPQIGSKVEIIKIEFSEEITKLFLVEDIIYSSYGSANKVIGKFI